MCMVFIHHHLWVDPSSAGHHTMLITGQPPERFIASTVQKVQVCGSGVLKRAEYIYHSTQRRIITFYCDLWRLGSRAGSIHSLLTNNSPSQTSSLGLNVAGKRKNLDDCHRFWEVLTGVSAYLETLLKLFFLLASCKTCHPA